LLVNWNTKDSEKSWIRDIAKVATTFFCRCKGKLVATSDTSTRANV
jgi:hypothetical protein